MQLTKQDIKRWKSKIENIINLKFKRTKYNKIIGGISTKTKDDSIELVIRDLGSNDSLIRLQGFDGIPNVSKLEKVFKKYFGDVTRKHGSEFIDARAYNVKVKTGISEPASKKPIKDVILPENCTKQKANEIVNKIRDRLKDREVKISGKPKVQVLSQNKNSIDKIFTYKGNYYFSDLRVYYANDFKEAELIRALVNVRDLLLRGLEVASWNINKFNDPFGGDLN